MYNATLSSPQLDAIFAALADPTRRAILSRLASGELSVNELEKEIDAHTDVGQRLTAAERSNLILLQRLAEAGKIQSISGIEAALEVPPLPF